MKQHKPKFVETVKVGGEIHYGVTTDIWSSFDRLLFSISRADGKYTVRDLKSMNCVEFYRHKTLLAEHIKRRGSRS